MKSTTTDVDPVLLNDWHVVARVEDVPQGQPVAAELLGEKLVLWRGDAGIHAWADLCVHRGARLALGRVAGNTLACPYHGWVYDGSGQCIRFPAHPRQKPPASAHARVYPLREAYGWVWVTLGEPAQDVPAFPQWDDTSFRKIHCGPYTVRASGPRIIENFLDVAHFPFVHEHILGTPERTEINDYSVETTGEGVVARNVAVWQPDPDGRGVGASVNYVYEVERPLTARFIKSSEGPRFAMILTVTPVSELCSIAWTYVAMDFGDVSDAAAAAFQDAIFRQDVPIVESQRPELLPLDLQAELHLRSDRLAIAYRRWLKQLGLTFGTS